VHTISRLDNTAPVGPACKVGRGIDGEDDVVGTGSDELVPERDVLAVGGAIDELDPGCGGVFEGVGFDAVEGLCIPGQLLCCCIGRCSRTYTRPIGHVVCASAHSCKLSTQYIEKSRTVLIPEPSEGISSGIQDLLVTVVRAILNFEHAPLTLKRLALVPMMKPA
jgi:hypothetical protein